MLTYGFVSVQDTHLAAALATMGVPFFEPKPFEWVVKDGKNICIWNFSADQKQQSKAVELVNLWKSQTAETDNPEHPIFYLRAYVNNYNRLLDAMKQAKKLYIIKRGGRTYLITK